MDPVTWTKLFVKLAALHHDVRKVLRALQERDPNTCPAKHDPKAAVPREESARP
jgi:hypothetical protein